MPNHIAIIMDGNGRWAKKRLLPRTIGHKAGVEAIREIVKQCSVSKVKYLTLYAFSTENWKRPKTEVNALMSLLIEYLKREIDELDKSKVVLNTIGDTTCLPDVVNEELNKAIAKTKNNDGLVLTLALNYGSRNDIKNAIVQIINDVDCGKIDSMEYIDEDTLGNYLSTKDLPNPDILIRTGGECRVSNFLLWEMAYSELFFKEIYWPDFKKEHLIDIINEYNNRDRRFGGLK